MKAPTKQADRRRFRYTDRTKKPKYEQNQNCAENREQNYSYFSSKRLEDGGNRHSLSLMRQNSPHTAEIAHNLTVGEESFFNNLRL